MPLMQKPLNKKKRGGNMGTYLRAQTAWDQPYRASTPAEPAQHSGATVSSFLLHQAQLQIRELEKKLSDMSKLAHEDLLTGVLNRRGFEAAMTRELARARRQNTPLSLALLDIDDFKHINDQHGHATGDMALAHFAQLISGALRKTDTFARMGGEEFVIVLPDTPLEKAADTLARIQATLAEQALEVESQDLDLQFSAGLTQYGFSGDLGAVLETADAGLYQAKKAGKNRVVLV